MVFLFKIILFPFFFYFSFSYFKEIIGAVTILQWLDMSWLMRETIVTDNLLPFKCCFLLNYITDSINFIEYKCDKYKNNKNASYNIHWSSKFVFFFFFLFLFFFFFFFFWAKLFYLLIISYNSFAYRKYGIVSYNTFQIFSYYFIFP